ncbi:hypothetical protein NPA31_005710 [Aurantimonas sp. MSK8Z-1]|uniref:hypothetical protein n=1 Tax=Mangrovibrevibacter kandeliae TaxID=2968473 RepID=UPI0021197C92|nr:hypothetical protein [Aurantimonas sp. MSK8Z-1]MCW4114459.1 hypothetical protein [Aurantimonas sp. MSK8Z-1]
MFQDPPRVMPSTARRLRLAAVLATAPLAACTSMFPDEDPTAGLERARMVENGPSAQRLGSDGYPLLGAFPNTAAPQLDNTTVANERRQLEAEAQVSAAMTGGNAAAYQQSVSQMQALGDKTRADVAAAVATTAPAEAGAAAAGTPAPRVTPTR